MALALQRMGIEEALERIEAESFSSIPSVLIHLLALSSDPRTEALDLARLCERDISTSVRLLKVANSLYFAGINQWRITSLVDAIVRVGFRTAQEIIISSVVAPAMIARQSIMDYSTTGLWKHSIAVGVGNRLIHRKKIGGPAILDPYLVGLLHDMGIAAEHQVLLQQGFAEAVQRRYARGTRLVDEERDCLGFTHEELGRAMAQNWRFPASLTAIIGAHHADELQDPEHQALFHMNRMSEWISFVLNIGYCDFSKPQADQFAASRRALGLENHELQEICSLVKREMEAYTDAGWFSMPAMSRVA